MVAESVLSSFGKFVKFGLEKDLGNPAEPDERKDELKRSRVATGQAALRLRFVDTRSHVVHPEEAIDAAGHECEQECRNATQCLGMARNFVCVIVEGAEPVDAKETACNERQDDVERKIPLLDCGSCGESVHVFFLCVCVFTGETSTPTTQPTQSRRENGISISNALLQHKSERNY